MQSPNVTQHHPAPLTGSHQRRGTMATSNQGKMSEKRTMVSISFFFLLIQSWEKKSSWQKTSAAIHKRRQEFANAETLIENLTRHLGPIDQFLWPHSPAPAVIKFSQIYAIAINIKYNEMNYWMNVCIGWKYWSVKYLLVIENIKME